MQTRREGVKRYKKFLDIIFGSSLSSVQLAPLAWPRVHPTCRCKSSSAHENKGGERTEESCCCRWVVLPAPSSNRLHCSKLPRVNFSFRCPTRSLSRAGRQAGRRAAVPNNLSRALDRSDLTGRLIMTSIGDRDVPNEM